MERYQLGSAGINDFYFDESKMTGIMIGDDMIVKVLAITSEGQIENKEFIEVDSEYYCIAGSSANGKVIYAGENNQAHTTSISDTNNSSVFCEYLGKVLDIALDKDGVRACLVGNDKNPVIFSFDKNKKLSFDSDVACSLISCCWSPDCKTFAVVAKNGTLSLYNVDDDFTEIKRLHHWKISEKDIKEDYYHGINPQFVSEDKLIVAGKDCLQIITRKDGTWLYSISSKIKHQSNIYHVAHLRDNFIATVSQDKKLSIWNLSLELKLNAFELNYKVLRIRFLSTNDIIAVLDDQGQIFTATNSIRAANIQTAQILPDTQSENEVSNKELPSSSRDEVDKREHNLPSADLDNGRMDEERRVTEVHGQENTENSNYRIEDDKLGFDSFVGHKNRNLVYEEAEEADMRRGAGILEELESKYDRSNQKQVRTKREDIVVQPAFIPGSTTGTGDSRSRRHYICYNMYGKVMWRTVGDKNIIDAEYSLGSLSKQGILNDANYNMASINYRGVLLASTGQIIKEDEYMDEEKTDKQLNSFLTFASSDRKKNWEVNFGRNENVLNVALGIHCSVVYTNKKIVRVFSPEGKEDQIFGFSKPVIGMTIYENLLAIVYHDTLPFSGSQTSRLQIINLSSREVVNDIDIVLSFDSKLKWYGFSEEGIFYVQDSKYMLWGQQNQSLWAPVYDGAKEANMWILGVSEQTIIYVKLPYGEQEPSVFIDYPPSNTTFRPPFVKDDGKERFLELLKYDQGRLRHSYFGHMKNSNIYEDNTQYEDPMTVNRQGLKTEDQVEKLSLQVDKINIDRARIALLHGDDDAAIFYGLQLENTKTLEICLRMFESLGQSKVAERLKIETDKLGNVQYKIKSNTSRRYIPQLVLQSSHEVRYSNQTDPDFIVARQTEITSLLGYNSLKMNKGSFADIVDQNKATHTATNVYKGKSSESFRDGEDEKPKKMPTTSHDLFRDLSEMTKIKR